MRRRVIPASVSTILNDPAAYGSDVDEEAPIDPSEPVLGLTDEEIGLTVLRRYVRHMGRASRRFEAAHAAATTVMDVSQRRPMSPRRLSAPESARLFAEQTLRDCHTQIPAMYFDQDFSLALLPMFQAKVTAAGHGTAQHGHTAQFQHQLSEHLDLVEVSLTAQVSARSQSFFTALHDIHALYAEIGQTVRAIQKIRDKVRSLHAYLVGSTLGVVHSTRRRKNARALIAVLERVETVVRAQPTVRLLVSTGDFTSAIDLIGSVRQLLSRELRAVVCLRDVDVKLAELQLHVERNLEVDFFELAVRDFGGTADGKQADDKSASSPFSATALTAEDKDRLRACVYNLDRLHRLTDMVPRFREHTQQVVRDGLTTLVESLLKQWEDTEKEDETKMQSEGGTPEPSVGLPVAQAVNAATAAVTAVASSGRRKRRPRRKRRRPLSERIKGVSHDRALALLKHVGAMLVRLLSRVAEVRNVVVRAMIRLHRDDDGHVMVGSSSPSQSPRHLIDVSTCPRNVQVVSEAFAELVKALCEFCQSKVSKLVTLRQPSLCGARLSDVCAVVAESTRFTKKCESLCGGNTTLFTLRGSLLSLSKAFVAAFHTKSMTRLTAALESESWQRVDVPPTYQTLVDVKWRVSDVPTKNGHHQHVDVKDPTKWHKWLYVPKGNDRRGYPIVNSLLTLMSIIETYTDAAHDLPSVGVDVCSRLAELLKFFNSRTCQLVLGAGALKLAGLKSITATNLALSSTCLDAIGAQIPMLRAVMLDAMPAKYARMADPLNRVVHDLVDHRREVYAMLVSIVTDLVQSTCKSLLQLPWARVKSAAAVAAAAEAEGGSGASGRTASCVVTLLKQTASLHRSLTELLDVEDRDAIFSDIGQAYSATMSKFLSRIDITKRVARVRVSTNVAYVLDRLERLGVKSAGKGLLPFLTKEDQAKRLVRAAAAS